MKSRTTAQFRKAFIALPEQVQKQTREAYRQFKRDPGHPSLRFKKVHPNLPIYSARISKSYRAVGQMDKDTVILKSAKAPVAKIFPVVSSTPRWSFRQVHRLLMPCCWVFHSPSP